MTGENYTDKFRNQVTTTTGAKAEFFDKSFSLNADFTFRSNWYNNTKKNTVVSYSPAPGKTVWVGTPGTNDYMQETWYRAAYMSANAFAEYAKVWKEKHDFKAFQQDSIGTEESINDPNATVSPR